MIQKFEFSRLKLIWWFGLVFVASFFEFSCQNCLSGKISQLQVIVPKVSNIYSKAMTMLQNGHLAVLK